MSTLTHRFEGTQKFWTFLPRDRREASGKKRKLLTGRRYDCNRGDVFEPWGCVNMIDALSKTPGALLCRVEIEDATEFDGEYVLGGNRKIVASASAEHFLHEKSIGWMEEILGHVPDPEDPAEEAHMQVLKKGIEIKKAWVSGGETTENLLAYNERIDDSCVGFSCRRGGSNEYWLWYLAGRALRYGYDFRSMDGGCQVKGLPALVVMAAGYHHALMTGEGAGPGEWMRERELNSELATAALGLLKERCRYTEAAAMLAA